MRTTTSLFREVVGPSLTATLVAAVRALYADLPAPYRVAPDDAAKHLVPWPLALPAHLAHRAGPALASALHVGFGQAFLGVTYHISLRTFAIDEGLRAAIAGGTRQIVLLGAGLDNRAARIEELADCRVFEVDHPATQRYKTRRLEAAGWSRPANVTLVGVDFERAHVPGEGLHESLARAGHEASAPTFWIWEGVTVYLSRDAIASTLSSVAAGSAPRSRLALTYTRPGKVGSGSMWGVTTAIARAIGEPVRGMMTGEELAGELGRVGFALESDESSFDWAARVWGKVPPGLREWERLAIAAKA